MDFKDEVTDADKANGYKLKVGAVVSFDGSEDNTVNFSYSQIKNMMAAIKVDNVEDLIGKQFMLVWNNMEGLEARYTFVDA
jgi:hypothetical protein